MASLKQASQVDMKGWEPAPKAPPDAGPKPTPNPVTNNVPMRASNMLASMPLMASTSDAFMRQFYGGVRVPTYRILPTNSGGS